MPDNVHVSELCGTGRGLRASRAQLLCTVPTAHILHRGLTGENQTQGI